jgi:hypothetical protein
MMSRVVNLALAVPEAVGGPGAQADPAARPTPAACPAPATRPGRGPGPAGALHGVARATRAQALRLAGPEAVLAAALGTGLAAVLTAVTVAAVRRGLAGVAPVARVTVPWTPLAAIALACLVVAVLGSVLTAAAAQRDPGQTLAAAAGGQPAAGGSRSGHLARSPRARPGRLFTDVVHLAGRFCPVRCTTSVIRGAGTPARARPDGSLSISCDVAHNPWTLTSVSPTFCHADRDP